MKKILIMGANPETVSLIIKAKKMGYKFDFSWNL